MKKIISITMLLISFSHSVMAMDSDSNEDMIEKSGRSKSVRKMSPKDCGRLAIGLIKGNGVLEEPSPRTEKLLQKAIGKSIHKLRKSDSEKDHSLLRRLDSHSSNKSITKQSDEENKSSKKRKKSSRKNKKSHRKHSNSKKK